MSDLVIHYPPDLPVSERREDILSAIKQNQVVIIAGATGSGKTTQLPKMCLELGRLSIAHTQPRRIAARSVAERISEELNVNLGGLVGYQVRFTDQASKDTKIKVMTDGILLNALQRDKMLKQYDTIIIDEAHERSLNIDFLLGYLKQLLARRPDLKLIITSATIDPGSFSKHFNDAPIIEVSGRTYPIEIRYRPVTREASEDGDPEAATTAADYLDGVVAALKELEAEQDGDVLVFLSGESEIRDCQDAIQGNLTAGSLKTNTEVLPLYGRLSSAEQHRVFEPSKLAGIRRRVILATNVAETSLTIPNIKYVIDAGTARISRYSPRAKVQRLPIEAVSQASANQRAGRAGRTSPGTVIRLYSQEDYQSRSEFTDPEILRTNLASVILQAANIGLGDITKFPFLQAPDSRGVKDGLGLLRELGAIEESADVVLTQMGKELSRIPIEPRFGRMLLESKRHNLVREVMIIVAGLTIQDPRERPLEKREKADLLHARFIDPTSDFLSLLNLWNHVEDQQAKLSSSAFRRLCKAEFLNYLRVREWQDLVRQLKSVTKELGLNFGGRRVDPNGIHKSLLAGLLSQIGLKQENEKKVFKNGKLQKPKRVQSEYLGSGSKKFVIFPGSALARKPPEALMSAELVETSRLFARMNAAIDPVWAEELAGELCKRNVSEPHWEKKLGAVIGYERVILYGLTLIAKRKVQYSKIDPMFCRELFIRHALVMGEWDSIQPFDKKNRDLLIELEAIAERARAPQLAPGEEDVFRFYNNRIPLDVFSTRSFEGWWKRARVESPELMTMTKSNILEQEILEPSEQDLPKTILVNGQQFLLRYKFEPGAKDDGLSVLVPLPILASLDRAAFEWLVPGMRLELITELIRSLPKSLRKNVVPAKDWAQKALAQMPDNPVGDITSALAKTLQKLSGVAIKAEDFVLASIDQGLRVKYAVLDDNSKELGLSSNLAELQISLATNNRAAVALATQSVTSPIERSAIPGWDFDSLPESVEVSHGGNLVRGFPALVLENTDAVAIRVFSTHSEQLTHHKVAVVQLVVLAISSPHKYIESHLSPQEKLAIAALPYKSLSGFVQDVIRAAAFLELSKINQAGLIFTRAEFEGIRDSVEAKSIELAFEIVKIAARIANALRDANKAISETKDFDFLQVLASEKQHISELLSPRFVSDIGLERLPRLEIYLRTIELRIQKLRQNPQRDNVAQYELSQAISFFELAGGSFSQSGSGPVAQARWLIEEFRVSLFAQSLGTTEPVSLQRIKKLLS
ncbi:ATP-dependent RNA helicase HrpA [Candidatus Aquiluna sp. UB-MaderosW2red]|uniref:ATP-dependent RNA helicase HrpA n=1 Tax=Candidatus Aquiluna sp. UB-MaderosW2red TaxID=1855377 RepID=UPI000875AE7C|nr:ATP-dependent RNA helicase HrpA [Candidatus Aquiluna sp. UB-MaderosW2red]SCX15287.1 ATP-dependent helicase HrpA [Candidatus Aquiluna sp. UB-MaderosW2red]